MAVVENVSDESANGGAGPASAAQLLRTLQGLTSRLKLPEELLPSFLHEDKPQEALEIYREHVLSILGQIGPHLSSRTWSSIPVQDRATVIFDVLRLYGADSWTSPLIQREIESVLSPISTSEIALYILQHPLKALFTTSPHPMLNTSTSRALARPAGGPDAHSDFHDESTQRFKRPGGWGCYNALSWCTAHLSPEELERRIGLVLPPTLVMMDDWEPPWRGRGTTVLEGWMDKVSPEVMRRMGLDKLLVDSLVHTLELRANPPIQHVLPVALEMVARSTTGEKRAERYAEIMDKAIVQGWIYAPSGAEGRPTLIYIAREVEIMCGVLGVGILRWLKAIIPNLLNPLQYTPTSAVLPHFEANLSALLCVMETLRDTGRIARWRGQLLDVLSRLWLQLGDRGEAEEGGAQTPRSVERVRQLIGRVFVELRRQHPAVSEGEYETLLSLDRRAFSDLIPISA